MVGNSYLQLYAKQAKKISLQNCGTSCVCANDNSRWPKDSEIVTEDHIVILLLPQTNCYVV